MNSAAGEPGHRCCEERSDEAVQPHVVYGLLHCVRWRHERTAFIHNCSSFIITPSLLIFNS